MQKKRFFERAAPNDRATHWRVPAAIDTYLARFDVSPQPWTFVTAVHYHCFICLSTLLHSALRTIPYPSVASHHVTLPDTFYFIFYFYFISFLPPYFIIVVLFLISPSLFSFFCDLFRFTLLPHALSLSLCFLAPFLFSIFFGMFFYYLYCPSFVFFIFIFPVFVFSFDLFSMFSSLGLRHGLASIWFMWTLSRQEMHIEPPCNFHR